MRTRNQFSRILNIKTAVVPLLIINIIVFILQTMLDKSFTANFMLISKDVLIRPWILLTHMFLHANGNHLFWNMFALFMFGPILEQRIGAKRFLLIYLASGIIAGIATSLPIFGYTAALGASGAIMGMLGALIILMPNLRLLFFFIIPMPLWVAGIIWTGLDLYGYFNPSGVGNVAHLVGLGVGLLYGYYLRGQRKTYHKKFSQKGHLEQEDMEEYFRTGRI